MQEDGIYKLGRHELTFGRLLAADFTGAVVFLPTSIGKSSAANDSSCPFNAAREMAHHIIRGCVPFL
jgi:hypothetical protein